jgi:hypothetical protein
MSKFMFRSRNSIDRILVGDIVLIESIICQHSTGIFLTLPEFELKRGDSADKLLVIGKVESIIIKAVSVTAPPKSPPKRPRMEQRVPYLIENICEK